MSRDPRRGYFSQHGHQKPRTCSDPCRRVSVYKSKFQIAASADPTFNQTSYADDQFIDIGKCVGNCHSHGSQWKAVGCTAVRKDEAEFVIEDVVSLCLP